MNSENLAKIYIIGNKMVILSSSARGIEKKGGKNEPDLH